MHHHQAAQQPHSHSHHEASRHLQRAAAVIATPSANVINPRILDANIHYVTERLSNEQKAEVLIHAMNLLRLANPFSHHIVENGVLSCLQAANLGTPQRVQALLLRGRARMASGDPTKAREDLYSVLELVPDHAVAASLLSIPSSANATHEKSRLWSIDSASRRLSPEIWRKITSFLPRRDLKTLLRLPHVLSRIAFELVFQTVDLHLGICRLHIADSKWTQDKQDLPSIKLEKQLSERTADILARIILDPSFAKLIKTVRISAERRDREDHMGFRTNVLATALPRLVNLKEVIFSGSTEVWNRVSDVISTSHPRLESLTLEPDLIEQEPNLPYLTHLSQFKFVRDHTLPNITMFLVQNRSALRRLCLCSYYSPFPPSLAIALSNLTHLEFVGIMPSDSNVFTQIFQHTTQLVSLRMTCMMLTSVSPQFRAQPHALPYLKNFGFRALDNDMACADSALFPSIADFLRMHPNLEKLELDVVGEANQKSMGYDASIMGVLPEMKKLRQLAITITKDVSPGLFSWIIPRGLLALLLNGVPKRTLEQFISMMRPGLPPRLRYIALLDVDAHEAINLADHIILPSVRLVNLGEKYYTVHRASDGHVDALKEWPERRMQLHAEEWLEALECSDAIWDDFGMGNFNQ